VFRYRINEEEIHPLEMNKGALNKFTKEKEEKSQIIKHGRMKET
jgi:hypothetical protein